MGRYKIPLVERCQILGGGYKQPPGGNTSNTFYTGGVGGTTTKNRFHLKKFLPLVAIVVVVVLVIVWICNLFTNTAENAAKAHIKSLSKKELEEKVQTYLDEELYYYEDVEIKKVIDWEEIDDDDFDGINQKLDLDKEINEGYNYEFKLEYDDGTDETREIFVFKYRGKWYSYNACCGVSYSAAHNFS